MYLEKSTSFKQVQTEDLADLVNPLVGSGSTYEFSHGNTYPSVALPFAMIQWTPQTDSSSWIYQYHATKIQGFRGTHAPSVWMGEYGSFTIVPQVGPLKIDPKDRALAFKHKKEFSRPYQYKVSLDINETERITTEIVPSMRGSMMRFEFPEGQEARILLDINPGSGYVHILAEQNKIIGYSSYGGQGNPPNFSCYFVAQFDRPILDFGSWKNKLAHPEDKEPHDEQCGAQLTENVKEQKGEGVGAYVTFKPKQDQHSKEGMRLQMRIATSFISQEQAQANLSAELADWDFEANKQCAKQIWNEVLSRIEIKGGTAEQRVIFYTAFYRTLLYPRIIHEPIPKQPGLVRPGADNQGASTPPEKNDTGSCGLEDSISHGSYQTRYYSPFDGKIYQGFMYTDTGLWDTYRAQFPLLAILFPDKVSKIIGSGLDAYQQGGWLPKWPSPGYRSVMIGTHADSVICDAYFKGIRGFDVDLALEAMLKNAQQPGDHVFKGREGIEFYQKLGYVPCDKIKEATAGTLGFAYDDFCIARLAESLNKPGLAAQFYKRAKNYTNVYDPDVGFMRGRLSDGSWMTSFHANEWGGPFTESCAWHYLWSVQHDVYGLIELMGGPKAFENKLDSLFDTPPDFKVGGYGRVIHEMREMEAAKMGQYAHHNEPVHHVLYMYNYIGQAYKTQMRVRQVLDSLYGSGPDGMLGDEDTGQMSAWYILSALGFYPVNPGQPIYAIGSPLFKEAIIHLPNGKQFKIKTINNQAENIYIQEADLNGQNLDKAWFQHSQLVDGGELCFVMGPKANKEWGSDEDQLPPAAMP